MGQPLHEAIKYRSRTLQRSKEKTTRSDLSISHHANDVTVSDLEESTRRDPRRRLCSREHCHAVPTPVRAPESKRPQPLPIASSGPQRKVHVVQLALPTSPKYTTGHHSALRVGGFFPPTKLSLKFKYQICAVKARRK